MLTKHPNRPSHPHRLPTPDEIQLAPGDLVVLSPKARPKAPMAFGEVMHPPCLAFVLNPHTARARTSRLPIHPLRRMYLSSFRILSVERGGEVIAQVLTPPPRGSWTRSVPRHPGMDTRIRGPTAHRSPAPRPRTWTTDGAGGSYSLADTSEAAKKKPGGLDAYAAVRYAGEGAWTYTIVTGTNDILTPRSGTFPTGRKAIRAMLLRLAALPPTDPE